MTYINYLAIWIRKYLKELEHGQETELINSFQQWCKVLKNEFYNSKFVLFASAYNSNYKLTIA